MANSSASDANPALGRAALTHWVRTVTDGTVELQTDDFVGAIAGAVVGGTGFCQTTEERGLGGLLRWALAADATKVVVFADADVAGAVARRAALIDFDITVWSTSGTEVEPATPTPVLTPPELAVSHRQFGGLISEAGARPIDDHGMLVAEVAGLEVARVVDDEFGAQLRDGGEPGPTLAVGVGQADRELQDYIHGHLDDDTNLRRAIAAVVQHRNPGSAVHPLSRVARQRWLRSVLLDDPSILGLDELEPLIPLRPRETVLGDEPSAAAGAGAVVVCSVGIDLDLLPEAAEYRARDFPDAELIVVVPERDRSLTAGSLASLIPNLRVVSIPEPWAAQ